MLFKSNQRDVHKYATHKYIRKKRITRIYKKKELLNILLNI